MLESLECYDAYRNEQFKMNVNIMMNVLDYPGQNKLFHCIGKCMSMCMYVCIREV